MSFPSPRELAQHKAAERLQISIEDALAHAERVLEQGHINNRINIEFHSTPSEAVEVVVRELEASGWNVLSAHIYPGCFTHYLTVKYRL